MILSTRLMKPNFIVVLPTDAAPQVLKKLIPFIHEQKYLYSFRTHMQDLKDVTNDTHYENYRCEKLAAMTVGSPTNQPSSK